MSIVLVEATVHDGTGPRTIAASSAPYLPPDSALEYDDNLATIPVLEEAIDQSVSVSSIRLLNDGSYDHMLPWAWEGWPVTVLTVANADTPRADAQVVFAGVMGPVRAPAPESIVITALDANAALDVPVQTNLLADNTPVPLVFGSVFNATPVLIDPQNEVYKASELPLTSLTVRAGGLPISHSVDLANGTFQLNNSPQGDVTFDATQQDATAQQIITALAARAGLSYSGRSLPNAPMGLFISAQTSVLDAIQMVARSVGGVARRDAQGAVDVVRLDNPETTSAPAVAHLVADDVSEGTLRVQDFRPPAARIDVGYARNWTPQRSVLGAVPAADRERYQTEYLVASATNADSGQFPRPAYPDRIDTLLIAEADAQAEAQRRASLRAVKRGTYQAALLTDAVLRVGDLVTLDHPRYGFSGGAPAFVVRVKRRPLSDAQELVLWR